jgi:hypothetical protein
MKRCKLTLRRRRRRRRKRSSYSNNHHWHSTLKAFWQIAKSPKGLFYSSL